MSNGDCYFVDGFDETTDTVYEIHGCFYHGCPKCTNPTLEHPNHPGIENKAIYDGTIKREERLKEANYNVISWWEHEINDMLKQNSEMRDFFNKVLYFFENLRIYLKNFSAVMQHISDQEKECMEVALNHIK